MDIAALLAESNREAVAAEDNAYDTEEFEDENLDDSNLVGKDGKIDKIQVLKAAAAKVAVEEKKNADRVFNEMAELMDKDIKRKNEEDEDPEAILAGASKAVNEHYNRQDCVDADKYRSEEEEKEKESDHDDEGEDDEDDNADDDPELNQSLLFAVYNERMEAAKTALRKGANYFTRDRHGWTPLHWAASKGFADIMEALIEHVKSRNRNVAKYINAPDSLTGWTPLHVACVGGHLSAIEVLLRYKARKNKLNYLKEKPSDCIGKSKHPKQIRELLGVPLRPAADTYHPHAHPHAHDNEDDDEFGDYKNTNDYDDCHRGESKENRDGERPAGAGAGGIVGGGVGASRVGPGFGGIPTGRTGRPPIAAQHHTAATGCGTGAGGVYIPRYERGNNFSDDGENGYGSAGKLRNRGEEKDRR